MLGRRRARRLRRARRDVPQRARGAVVVEGGGVCGGGGETYLNEREELWWSKGGELAGESPPRIRFLLSVIDAAPDGVLEPLPSDWDVRWGGADGYRIAYFGFGRPRYRGG